jgi:regulator of protease activity HflC (stomatin/prohibitin superfamily)
MSMCPIRTMTFIWLVKRLVDRSSNKRSESVRLKRMRENRKPGLLLHLPLAPVGGRELL